MAQPRHTADAPVEPPPIRQAAPENAGVALTGHLIPSQPRRPGSPDRRGWRGLRRRGGYRLARAVAVLRRVTVRQAGAEAVRISRLGRRRRYPLDDPAARYLVTAPSLIIVLNDPAALARVAASGVLDGEVRRLTIRLRTVPRWLVMGARPARVDRTTEEFSWRRRGRGVQLVFRWSKPYDLSRALTDALAAVLRARPWDQTSGPVYAVDRGAWTAGDSCWPQGRLVSMPPAARHDDAGRPLGPFAVLARPRSGPAAGDPPGPARALGTAVVAGPAGETADLPTSVTNPYGRCLLGAATRYRLAGDAARPALYDRAGARVAPLGSADEAIGTLLTTGIDRYAVVIVEAAAQVEPGTGEALRVLAACGVVFAAPDPQTRARLGDLGLVVVPDPDRVTDLHGYALSVAAARRMAIAADAALRRTELAGDGALPLPTVSVLLSSMRPDHIDTCLGYLAAQTYPALEVVVGLHGYDVDEEARRRWRAAVPYPLRIVPIPAEISLGMALGWLSRVADGELIAKVDDDDHYGPHHVTDLFLAWHTSGADVAGKGARFVHLPERAVTIDRAWAAPELFNQTPAGGTLLLARGALQQFGGWSHSSRHVDADLLTRVRSAGGVVYRTHSLEYAYVRRAAGHTYAIATELLAEQGSTAYPGLPDELLRPPAAG